MQCSYTNQYILLFLMIPVSSTSCELTFDGDQFLKSSYSKGISPENNCYVANINENRFYSLPSESCTVNFSTSSWLDKEWSFKSIQGTGTFSVQKSSSGINVIIKEEGGFRLKNVTLQSKIANCENITVEDVL